MHSFFTDIAEVYRQSLDTDTGKSEEALVWNVKGFLKAVSIQEVNQTNGTFWEDHNFTCHISSDIKKGDIVKINDLRYAVKAVGEKRAIQLAYKICKITLSNKTV